MTGDSSEAHVQSIILIRLFTYLDRLKIRKTMFDLAVRIIEYQGRGPQVSPHCHV